ncbi:conserved hypothetical protein [uncultured Desulfatiglans sp.]|uniref:Uncharacterized protein n=1 Tax=Uncultured Desulfatiglans sp. TaxID=1748965 RepID=A0A653A3W5_UNCDX|nr:conserved hypothetical protein [uncultured Desulfatiglans sp.]
MATSRKTRQTTLEGYVAPAKWNEDGQVTAVIIQTGEEEYLVDMDTLGEELLDYLHEDVEVTGVVTLDAKGVFHLRVSNYALLDDLFDDEDEEDALDAAEAYEWDDDDLDADDDDDDDDDDYRPKMR